MLVAKTTFIFIFEGGAMAPMEPPLDTPLVINNLKDYLLLSCWILIIGSCTLFYTDVPLHDTNVCVE
jgi:hypothetical protein